MAGFSLTILCLVSLAISVVALVVATKGDPKMRRAFRHLEQDVEKQLELVNSHLGRVSRLKRDMMRGTTTAAESSNPENPSPESVPLPSQPKTRAELLARMGG